MGSHIKKEIMSVSLSYKSDEICIIKWPPMAYDMTAGCSGGEKRQIKAQSRVHRGITYAAYQPQLIEHDKYRCG